MAASMEESNALDGLEDVDNPTQAEAASERRGSSFTMEDLTSLSRRQKRKELKKMRRKEHRQQIAKEVRRMEQMMLQDPVEQLKMRLREQEEAEAREKEQLQHEEEEKLWLQKEKEAQEVAERRRLLEEEEKKRQKEINSKKLEEEEQWEYVEEGPAEVIWQGNEIIVRKQRVRVPKGFQSSANPLDDLNRPTSNPLPPQSTVFAEHNKLLAVNSMSNAYDGIDNTPNFGTEQDKTHCPFHIKTGVCSHAANYQYTDEEVAQHFEEFYEDVHSEFLRFGELVNFKVCKNASSHLRGNVYVHYISLDSAIAAYNAMNGRFYAGKQVTCEFVGVTRWRVAICGEYMKAHHQTCSHGSQCNFLHCFRNPRGEYEWADWDTSPPRFWQVKMNRLFYGERGNQSIEHNDEDQGTRKHERRGRHDHKTQHFKRRNSDLHERKGRHDMYELHETDEKDRRDHMAEKYETRDSRNKHHERTDSFSERSRRHHSYKRRKSPDSDISSEVSRGRWKSDDIQASKRSSHSRQHRSRRELSSDEMLQLKRGRGSRRTPDSHIERQKANDKRSSSPCTSGHSSVKLPESPQTQEYTSIHDRHHHRRKRRRTSSSPDRYSYEETKHKVKQGHRDDDTYKRDEPRRNKHWNAEYDSDLCDNVKHSKHKHKSRGISKHKSYCDDKINKEVNYISETELSGHSYHFLRKEIRVRNTKHKSAGVDRKKDMHSHSDSDMSDKEEFST